MEQKNIGEGTEGEEDDNKSEPEPRPRRAGSPAMSVASAVLEWDPSADVGAMGSTSSDGKVQDARNQLSQRNVLEGYSECDIVYGPKVYDLEGGKSPIRSRPGSGARRGHHQNVKGCTYSTPSSSPAPLVDLQYSPVVPQSSYNHEQNSNVHSEARSSQNVGIDATSKGKLAATTSDEDNNDDLTEGRRTPGRAVSESSTDWEYDQDKNVPTRSLSQWQTSGLTKSEIEYQTRKKNSSSTSIASSVLMLKVETKFGSPDRGSPENKRNNGRQPVDSSSQEKSEESELNRKIQKILKEHQAKRKHRTQTQDTGTTSVSDPSTMCGLVKDYVQLLDGDTSKENIQYDVLKKHRDYHLMKVWKQISTLEKLNMQLIRLESARARQSKQSNARYRGGEGDADYRPRHGRRGGGPAADEPNILSMRNDLAQELAAFFRNNGGVVKDNSTVKSSRKEYSSDPVMTTVTPRMLGNIPANFHATARGTSMPYLTSKTCRESKETDYRASNRDREEIPKRKKSSRSKPRERISDADIVIAESEIEDDRENRRNKATGAGSIAISIPVLKELISKIIVPEEMLKQQKKQQKKYADKKKSSSSKNSSTSLSVKVSSTDNYSDEERYQRETEHRSRPKTRHGAKSSSDQGRKDRIGSKLQEDRKATPEVPKPKKPPVGFYVPLIGTMTSSGGSSNRRHKWFDEENVENGFYDVKGPMKIQDCLKENNPDCYQSIKERDEFIIQRKMDRQIREESLLKEILASDIPSEDVEEYMSTYLKYCNPEQKKRALDYIAIYEKTKASGVDRRIISSREMRERTARFLHYDFVERQKKEAQERKKLAIRNSQRNFSKNLRKYQQLGKVNVPDQLKLGRIK